MSWRCTKSGNDAPPSWASCRRDPQSQRLGRPALCADISQTPQRRKYVVDGCDLPVSLAAGTSARDPALSFPIRWIRWSECHLASPELMVDDLFNWNPASPPGRFQLWPHREV